MIVYVEKKLARTREISIPFCGARHLHEVFLLLHAPFAARATQVNVTVGEASPSVLLVAASAASSSGMDPSIDLYRPRRKKERIKSVGKIC